jgi:5'-nucleotidase
MSDEVDVVIAGHTHSELDIRVPRRDGAGSKLVVEALSYGAAFDRVTMRVDRLSGETVSASAEVPRTWHDEVKPDRRIGAHVRRYAARVAPLARRVIGTAGKALDRQAAVRGSDDTPLGTLLADAERRFADADFALVNPGSARADLAAGALSYAELFDVAAYEHPLMRMRLTGADLAAVLEQQWEDGRTTPLQVSGLRYRYDPSRPAGDRVTRLVRSNGVRIRPRRSYTVVANELIATGEPFSVLRERGRGVRRVGTDLEALSAHVEELGRGFEAPRPGRVARR